MSRFKNVFVLVLFAAALSFVVTGCHTHGDHTSKEHPSKEHPSKEHPSKEHPSEGS